MNKYKLLQLFLSLKKSQQKGISLIELIIALVISGIVLTAAASGFMNILRANQNIESKTVRSATLNRAITYMQNEVKEARTVTEVSGGQCSNVTSSNCMVLTYPDSNSSDGAGGTIASCAGPDQLVYYGYEDISSGTQIWLKPGVLKRKVVSEQKRYEDASLTVEITNPINYDSDDVCTTTTGIWQVIADGLISINESNPVSSFADDTAYCSQEVTNWTTGNLYGDNGSGKGGFRFCLLDTTAQNRLVRIFLYGHIMGLPDGNNTISSNIITFARSN
ncbi:prepilin-type N-terminal cleavage/methylation domain-containing protein [Cyanobacterium aponinum UTEX 3221]|uniref:PulJ/GspJ family protein n=1 Tax=Cyanobacterium aponinum TaxID=379064 RepID=UPI002B4C0E46|nr:prepilin-type N-terminal cleavage/methylation domain-containing protein [Cyanobacterium aponinum]WRL36902.1 prepilin-type N-terminal cleavage/methylation domain-containing protein [Cyanobacterium aponinum UTEX 3221]